MQAQEVIDHLEALGTWVDWNKTRDIVLAGDVTREIERVGVTWVATMACVHDAVARGIHFMPPRPIRTASYIDSGKRSARL